MLNKNMGWSLPLRRNALGCAVHKARIVAFAVGEQRSALCASGGALVHARTVRT